MFCTQRSDDRVDGSVVAGTARDMTKKYFTIRTENERAALLERVTLGSSLTKSTADRSKRSSEQTERQHGTQPAAQLHCSVRS